MEEEAGTEQERTKSAALKSIVATASDPSPGSNSLRKSPRPRYLYPPPRAKTLARDCEFDELEAATDKHTFIFGGAQCQKRRSREEGQFVTGNCSDNSGK